MSSIAAPSTTVARDPGLATPWLHRYAIAVSVCAWIVILIGSMVTTTGSGLAVPDWPTTYGQNMFTYPPSKWVGGIFYEHGHRLAAAGLGLLTCILAGWLWIGRGPRMLKLLGTAAFLVVCLQGLLGGITVLYKLPTLVSLGHAGLAQIFFCLTITIALVTSPGWSRRRASPCSAHPAVIRRWCVVALAVVYAQILLGALMRHTHSALAITDFPLSYGRLLPPISAAAIDQINEKRAWSEQEFAEVTRGQIWIHFAHRLGAVCVTLVAIVLLRKILRLASDSLEMVMLGTALIGLVILQIVLGAAVIWTSGAFWITTIHIGAGSGMLAVCLILTLRILPTPQSEGNV